MPNSFQKILRSNNDYRFPNWCLTHKNNSIIDKIDHKNRIIQGKVKKNPKDNLEYQEWIELV